VSGAQPLHERLVNAACGGDAAAIRALVAAGADPNYQNAQINTPLMWAATHRHLDAA
jgi:ankyrin repeat protein